MEAGGVKRRWTSQEIEVLRAEYPDRKTVLVAKKLGRSERSVFAKAAALGLQKTEEYLASPDACRLRRGQGRGIQHRFPKGHTPWNAGRKGWSAGGKSRETRFKKGEKPWTWKPIGSERVTKDGTLQRKVSDTGYPPRDWVAVHALLWREANGEIPEGHIVVFRNGDKSDIRMDNLELITRAENMRRNSYHNYPKEIATLIQLRGAINRQINKRASK